MYDVRAEQEHSSTTRDYPSLHLRPVLCFFQRRLDADRHYSREGGLSGILVFSWIQHKVFATKTIWYKAVNNT